MMGLKISLLLSYLLQGTGGQKGGYPVWLHLQVLYAEGPTVLPDEWCRPAGGLRHGRTSYTRPLEDYGTQPGLIDLHQKAPIHQVRILELIKRIRYPASGHAYILTTVLHLNRPEGPCPGGQSAVHLIPMRQSTVGGGQVGTRRPLRMFHGLL